MNALIQVAEEHFIDKAYRHYLPPKNIRVLKKSLESLMSQDLSPEEGFLVSRVNGSRTCARSSASRRCARWTRCAPSRSCGSAASSTWLTLRPNTGLSPRLDPDPAAGGLPAAGGAPPPSRPAPASSALPAPRTNACSYFSAPLRVHPAAGPT